MNTSVAFIKQRLFRNHNNLHKSNTFNSPKTRVQNYKSNLYTNIKCVLNKFILGLKKS